MGATEVVVVAEVLALDTVVAEVLDTVTGRVLALGTVVAEVLALDTVVAEVLDTVTGVLALGTVVAEVLALHTVVAEVLDTVTGVLALGTARAEVLVLDAVTAEDVFTGFLLMVGCAAEITCSFAAQDLLSLRITLAGGSQDGLSILLPCESTDWPSAS